MQPAHIPRSAAVRTTSFENSRNGIIGSSARCSTKMNKIKVMIEMANNTRTCWSVQPDRPSSKPIMRDATVADNRPAPRKSNFAVRRVNGSLRAKWQMIATPMMNGTLK